MAQTTAQGAPLGGRFEKRGTLVVTDHQNGWDQYKYKVIGDLERHEDAIGENAQATNDLRTEFLVFKAKILIIGAIGGIIGTFLMNMLAHYLKF